MRSQTSDSGIGFETRGLSLRSKLVLEFGAVIVGIMVMVIVVSTFGIPFTGYTGTLGYEKSVVLNTLGLVADLKKERFSLWLGERKDDVTLFSESLNISTLLNDLITRIQQGSPDGKPHDEFWTQFTKEPRYELLKRIHQIIAVYKAYHKIQIADASTGIIVASSDEKSLGLNVSDNPSFDKVLTSKREVVVDIQLDPTTTHPLLIVSRAIFGPVLKDTPTETPLGVAMFSIDTDAYLKPLLYTGTGMGETGDIVLVNRDSTILMPLKFPLPDGTIPKPLEYKIQARPAMMAAQGEEGVTIADDYRGVPVLSAYRHITVGPDHGLGLVVKRDQAEVFAPLWKGIFYTILVAFLGLMVAVLLVVLTAKRISSPIDALIGTAREVEAGNFAVRVPVKASDEIGALGATFNSMLDQIQKWGAEIERTNKELEAFSYSVSHDLRAPLRGIDGFSKALLEDYYEKVDETGRDYLTRVRTATQHMGRLIDDLLKLSRLTKMEMRQEPVPLSGIVTTIIDSLKNNEPDRSVECVVQEGITINGDPYLIEIAMENLLNNAWKFTGKTPSPRIQFGMTQKDGLNVCYIKDNGVGFDMTYSEKLFGAFQRLHSPEEFPGTGIGLVTVQRIIHRHRGRIWAEAELNKGATFFFTV
jgi:signal transduction histidine kinase